jgi:hypothetical protein
MRFARKVGFDRRSQFKRKNSKLKANGQRAVLTRIARMFRERGRTVIAARNDPTSGGGPIPGLVEALEVLVEGNCGDNFRGAVERRAKVVMRPTAGALPF